MNTRGHGMYISLLTVVLGFLMLPFLPGMIVVGYPVEMVFGEITGIAFALVQLGF